MATVLRNLVGVGQGEQAEPGQDGKLLELADSRDEATEEPTPGSRQGRDEEMMQDAADEAALASVITQVSRDQQAAAPPPAVQYAAEQQVDDGSGEMRSTWKNKFR